MNRREFIAAGGTTLLNTMLSTRRLFGTEPARPADAGIAWRRHEASRLFNQVTVAGRPLRNPEEVGGCVMASVS